MFALGKILWSAVLPVFLCVSLFFLGRLSLTWGETGLDEDPVINMPLRRRRIKRLVDDLARLRAGSDASNRACALLTVGRDADRAKSRNDSLEHRAELQRAQTKLEMVKEAHEERLKNVHADIRYLVDMYEAEERAKNQAIEAHRREKNELSRVKKAAKDARDRYNGLSRHANDLIARRVAEALEQRGDHPDNGEPGMPLTDSERAGLERALGIRAARVSTLEDEGMSFRNGLAYALSNFKISLSYHSNPDDDETRSAIEAIEWASFYAGVQDWPAVLQALFDQLSAIVDALIANKVLSDASENCEERLGEARRVAAVAENVLNRRIQSLEDLLQTADTTKRELEARTNGLEGQLQAQKNSITAAENELRRRQLEHGDEVDHLQTELQRIDREWRNYLQGKKDECEAEILRLRGLIEGLQNRLQNCRCQGLDDTTSAGLVESAGDEGQTHPHTTTDTTSTPQQSAIQDYPSAGEDPTTQLQSVPEAPTDQTQPENQTTTSIAASNYAEQQIADVQDLDDEMDIDEEVHDGGDGMDISNSPPRTTIPVSQPLSAFTPQQPIAPDLNDQPMEPLDDSGGRGQQPTAPNFNDQPMEERDDSGGQGARPTAPVIGDQPMEQRSDYGGQPQQPTAPVLNGQWVEPRNDIGGQQSLPDFNTLIGNLGGTQQGQDLLENRQSDQQQPAMRANGFTFGSNESNQQTTSPTGAAEDSLSEQLRNAMIDAGIPGADTQAPAAETVSGEDLFGDLIATAQTAETVSGEYLFGDLTATAGDGIFDAEQSLEWLDININGVPATAGGQEVQPTFQGDQTGALSIDPDILDQCIGCGGSVSLDQHEPGCFMLDPSWTEEWGGVPPEGEDEFVNVDCNRCDGSLNNHNPNCPTFAGPGPDDSHEDFLCPQCLAPNRDMREAHESLCTWHEEQYGRYTGAADPDGPGSEDGGGSYHPSPVPSFAGSGDDVGSYRPPYIDGGELVLDNPEDVAASNRTLDGNPNPPQSPDGRESDADSPSHAAATTSATTTQPAPLAPICGTCGRPEDTHAYLDCDAICPDCREYLPHPEDYCSAAPQTPPRGAEARVEEANRTGPIATQYCSNCQSQPEQGHEINCHVGREIVRARQAAVNNARDEGRRRMEEEIEAARVQRELDDAGLEARIAARRAAGPRPRGRGRGRGS